MERFDVLTFVPVVALFAVALTLASQHVQSGPSASPIERRRERSAIVLMAGGAVMWLLLQSAWFAIGLGVLAVVAVTRPRVTAVVALVVAVLAPVGALFLAVIGSALALSIGDGDTESPFWLLAAVLVPMSLMVVTAPAIVTARLLRPVAADEGQAPADPAVG